MTEPSGLSHLKLESIKDILHKLWEDPILKLGAGLVVSGIQWTFGEKSYMLLVVAGLVGMDTITGVWKAARKGELSSRGIFRVVAKLAVYFILMATGALVDKTMPISFALVVIWTFLAITEALSILENIALLGFPVPTSLIVVLKDLNKKNTIEEIKHD